jgi:hypothetical protein
MGYKYLSTAISGIAVFAHSVYEAFAHMVKVGNSGWKKEKMIETRQMIEDVIGLPKWYKIEEQTTEK